MLARQGSAVMLRRRAVSAEGPVEGPDGQLNWDRLVVSTFSTEEMAGEVASHLGDVVAVDPPELRKLVVERLTSLAGADA